MFVSPRIRARTRGWRWTLGAAVCAAWLATGSAAARTEAPPASPDVIEQRVQGAVALFEENGFEAACSAVSDAAGPFLVDQAYVFMLTVDGNLVCHPRPDLLGHPTGARSYVPDMLTNARRAAPQGAWTIYPWPHPNTYEISDKSTFCQITGPIMICAGAHLGAFV